MSKLTVSRVARLFPLSILLVTAPTFAQMIPLEDLRGLVADATYNTATDTRLANPPVPFAYWDGQCEALAEEYEPCESPPPELCLVGHCRAFSFQYSEFLPGGIQFSGGTTASWGIPPQGLYSVQSAAGFTFRIDNALDYSLFIIVDPGDDGGGGVFLRSIHSTGYADLYEVHAGQLEVTGRLGPGTYKLEGFSQGFHNWESYQGLVYFAQWTVSQPQAPHIAVQPSDHSAACGGSVVFSVGTTLPSSSYTFQWRKNFVPLTNGPNVLGATTSTLTIASVCTGDAADYDVVVTGPNPAGGTIAEPSRLAHLSVLSTPTAVEIEPASPTVAAVRAPAPNPFRVSTTVAYDIPNPMRLVATVFNASGARIRSLEHRTVSNSGSVTWDGRLRSGARAPVGIYFVRLELDDVHQTRKVVLLE